MLNVYKFTKVKESETELIGYFTGERLEKEMEIEKEKAEKRIEKHGGKVEELEGLGFKTVGMTDTYYQASEIEINKRVKDDSMSKEEEKKDKIQKILDDELKVVRNGVSGGFISGDLEAVNRIYEEVCKDE